jgi:hypothetical protein
MRRHQTPAISLHPRMHQAKHTVDTLLGELLDVVIELPIASPFLLGSTPAAWSSPRGVLRKGAETPGRDKV